MPQVIRLQPLLATRLYHVTNTKNKIDFMNKSTTILILSIRGTHFVHGDRMRTLFEHGSTATKLILRRNVKKIGNLQIGLTCIARMIEPEW